MKGAIFTGFAEFVETKYSLTTWLTLLDSCQLKSDGEYLASELYEDEEFFTLAQAFSEQVNVPMEDLFSQFGEFFFPTLMSLAVKHISHINDLFEFLHAVDSVIHTEVQKSDPLAYTPTLLYDQPQDNTLVMRYISKRKMHYFAVGLILGAAKYYKQEVDISITPSDKQGDESCLIRIERK